MAGIEPARDTDHDLLDAGRAQTLDQARDLDVERLGAALVPLVAVRRYVGKARDLPLQRHRGGRTLHRDADSPEPPDSRLPARRVPERRHAKPLLRQPLQVEVGREDLGLLAEALRLGQPFAVLVDQAVAVPGQVRGRLAGACPGVDVGGHRPSRLRRAQQPPVVRLADRHVARRQVEQHRRPGQRAVRARRQRRPQVLADLHVEAEPGDGAHVEQEVFAEGNVLAAQGHDLGAARFGGREVALLVVLAVVRQVDLRHDPGDPPRTHDRRDVEDRAVDKQRQSDDQRGPEVPRRFRQFEERRLRAVQHRRLVKQVVQGVAAQVQFGEDRRHGIELVRVARQGERALQVRRRIPDLHPRQAHGHAREPVFVQVVEAAHGTASIRSGHAGL